MKFLVPTAYRVIHRLADFGWVPFELGCSVGGGKLQMLVNPAQVLKLMECLLLEISGGVSKRSLYQILNCQVEWDRKSHLPDKLNNIPNPD